MAEQRFSITEFMAESAEDSAIYLYAVNTLEKRVLELALDNIYRPYLWRDWATSQDVIERIYMADITPYLADIIEAIKGMGGGGNTTINCCLGADGAGTLPLPEEVVEGDYEGTGEVPDYTEEDALFGASSNDNCRRGHYAANWIAELINTIGMPNPSTTDLVAVTALANRQIAQNSISTAVKLLPASDAAVVIDGVTGKIIRGGTAIGKVPKGGTLVGIIFYILTELLAGAIRGELAKWQNTEVVGNIIGSSPSLSVLYERLRSANLIESGFSVRRMLLMLTGVGTLVTGVGDIFGSIAGLWWIAINRDWDWFPDADTLAVMFPSVSCSYSPYSLVVRRFINSVAPTNYTANVTGGNAGFDIVQIGSGHSQSRVWVSQSGRLRWELNDTDLETGDPDAWRVRLYDYMPPIDTDSTSLITWLESNILTYPPSYEFALRDYVAESATVPFDLRGVIFHVSSSGNGGTMGFRVEVA